MKKIALAALAAILTFASLAHAEIYPTTFVIVKVTNNIVIAEDFNENLWAWEGAEDWMEGDIASAIMNDNGTPEIFDDEIVTVRYSGYIE